MTVNLESLRKHLKNAEIEVNKILESPMSIDLESLEKYSEKAKESEIEILKPKRRNKCNSIKNDPELIENYFNNIDSKNKAYWLGFITGDGNIQNKRLLIRLSDKDVDHLVKFKLCLNTNRDVKLDHQWDTRTKKYYEYCIITINNYAIIDALASYGVGSNKSKFCNIPDLPENLMRHYIRGVFCADGGLNLVKTSCMRFSLTSSVYDFLFNIRKILIEKCNLKEVKINCHNGGTWYSVIYDGNVQCRRIYDYLYGDGGVRLDRKYESSTIHFQKYDNTLTRIEE